MGGIFGTISKKSCVADLFYGTDYNSHLGTRRGGLATYSKDKGFVRSIHNLESSYFRTKFEPTLDKFEGATSGIGVISDTDAQPLIMNSHLGRFAICTVAKVVGVSTTGLAGPDGDGTGRPVGLAYIALDMEGFSYCRELHLTGGRSEIRAQAAHEALSMLLEFL